MSRIFKIEELYRHCDENGLSDSDMIGLRVDMDDLREHGTIYGDTIEVCDFFVMEGEGFSCDMDGIILDFTLEGLY